MTRTRQRPVKANPNRSCGGSTRHQIPENWNRTVPESLELQLQVRLQPVAVQSSCSFLQFMQLDFQTLVQVAHGKRAKDDVGGKDNEGTLGRPMTTRNKGSKGQGARMHQTRTAPDGRKRKNQVYALQDRGSGLARRGQSTYSLPKVKTSPEAIWTTPHQEGLIRRIIRTRPTTPMEDTPGDPRKPPDTLQRDGAAQAELYLTGTRSYQQRRRVQGRRSPTSTSTR